MSSVFSISCMVWLNFSGSYSCVGDAPGTLLSIRWVDNPNLVSDSYISFIIFCVPLMSMLFIFSRKNSLSASARAFIDQNRIPGLVSMSM